MDINKLEKILRLISSTIQSVRIYTVEHPKAKQAVKEVYSSLMEYCASFEICEIGIAGNEIFSGKEIFFELSKQLSELIDLLKSAKVERLNFSKNLSEKELENFFSVIIEVSENQSFEDLLKEKSIKFIGINFGQLCRQDQSQSASSIEKRAKSIEAYTSLLDGNKEVMDSIVKDISVDTGQVFNFSCDLFNLVSFNKESLFTMMNLKRHDDYTFVHSLNVAVLTMFQAQYLGLDRKDVVRLGMAGLLHDCGKKLVRNNLLNKKEKLSDKEFRSVQSHTLAGVDLLFMQEEIDSLAVIGAYQHHIGVKLERYPRAVYIKKQSTVAKIIAVSDVYDALRSRRSYKKGMPLEQVYEIMQREKGRILDTELVDLFFKNIGVWPEGTLVRLNSSELAIVKKNNPADIYSPTIEIVYDDQENLLAEPIVVDLTRQKDLHIKRKIESHITPETDEGKKYISALLGE